MAKRFTSTDIWDEDWFIDLPKDYIIFWFYVKDVCDHAGIFKVNVKKFNKMFGCKVDSEVAFKLFNSGKERLRKVNGSNWLLEDFFKFQYGHNFNGNNRLHESIAAIYDKVEVNLTSIRGLKVVKERTKGGQE